MPGVHPSIELYPWISAGAIVWGVMDCFFGYRIFKLTLAVLGGLIGVVLGQAAAAALGLTPGGEISAMVLSGLLGMTLAFLLYLAAVFVTGFGFGATLGLLLLTRFHPAVILLGTCILGVTGGLLAVKLQRVLIMLSTALLGAFRVVLALSYFTSQLDWLYYFQQPQQFPALIESHAWMFPGILALAAVGTIAQFELSGGSVKKKGRGGNE